MAAGAHFFSDILWSALLAFAVLHVLWYYVLTAAAQERVAAGSGHLSRLSTLLALLAGAGVLLALFATPHGTELTAQVPLTGTSPRALEVTADAVNVTLVLLDAPDEIDIMGNCTASGCQAAVSRHISSVCPSRGRLCVIVSRAVAGSRMSTGWSHCACPPSPST
jgi:hypothetical protein